MVNKDLTFIHLGNETKVDFLGKKASKDEGLINFEKLRMVAKEVRNLMNMCSGNFHNIFFLFVYQFGCENSKVVGSKKQDFCKVVTRFQGFHLIF